MPGGSNWLDLTLRHHLHMGLCFPDPSVLTQHGDVPLYPAGFMNLCFPPCKYLSLQTLTEGCDVILSVTQLLLVADSSLGLSDFKL